MWGGKVEHLAEPLSWENGAKGNSNAYIIQLLDDYKLVILSVAHFVATGLKDGTPVAGIPDNLAPAESNNFIRMPLSQHLFLANTGSYRLDIWTANGQTSTSDLYGTAIYIAKA